MSTGWMTWAACKGEDLSLFFGPDGERQPERDGRETEARQFCQACPVRADCLEYAVSGRQRHGVWGGLTERELALALRRRQRRERESAA